MTDNRKWYDFPDAGMRLIDAFTHGEDYETDVSVSGDEENDHGLYLRWRMERSDGTYLRRKRIPLDSGHVSITYMQTKFGLSRVCSKAYIVYESMEFFRREGWVHFCTPLRRELVVKWTDGSYSRKSLDRLRETSWMLPYGLRPGQKDFV